MCSKLSISQRLLCGVCSIPLVLGTCSLVLGIWLSYVVIHNGRIDSEQQIYFEKLIPWSEGGNEGTSNSGVIRLDNESPFSHTPLDNLSFYLLSLSCIMILGGSGRIITTTFFCIHLMHNRVTGQLFWAWLVLSTLAVTMEVLVAYDILHTLSHNDVAPPYQRDFFLTNDATGFYRFCHALRCFIWIDLAISGVCMVLVCTLYRVYMRQRSA
ncbi:unnamed protein product [Orchesella dallaii]|uniref:Uncharacterized protein n=1 Tax=Orchesella dallaii TaxID=48710 RepID=A0ABP1PSK0_9HEXA